MSKRWSLHRPRPLLVSFEFNRKVLPPPCAPSPQSQPPQLQEHQPAGAQISRIHHVHAAAVKPTSVSPPVHSERPHPAPSGGRGAHPPGGARPAWAETSHCRRSSLSATALTTGQRARIHQRAHGQAPPQPRPRPPRPPPATTTSQRRRSRQMLPGDRGWTVRQAPARPYKTG